MTCLYLSENDVEQLIEMRPAIEAMREAFVALAAGEAHNVPRVRARAPGIVLHSMSAAAANLGLAGWKQYTTTPRGALFHVGLYDQQTGALVALIAANRLGQLRTGAVTGLAIELLANPDAGEVGLFGSGWQARSQLAAAAAACPIKRAYVYSLNEQHRGRFAREMSAELGMEVAPVAEPRQAVEDRPIVITATTSREPVFDGRWLAEGALVCAIGSNWPHKAEIDVAAVRRADRIVCDSVACCQAEAGDFSAALEQGVFSWPQAAELADVVLRPSAGRGAPENIVLFKSVGMAIEDVALGGKLLELAKAQGIGRELPF